MIDLVTHRGTTRLAKEFAGKIVVVNAYAPWSLPSVKMLAALEKLHARYESDGLVVIVLVEEAPGTSDVLGNAPYDVVTWTDALRDAFPAETMPTTYVFDRLGKLVHDSKAMLGIDELDPIVRSLL